MRARIDFPPRVPRRTSAEKEEEQFRRRGGAATSHSVKGVSVIDEVLLVIY